MQNGPLAYLLECYANNVKVAGLTPTRANIVILPFCVDDTMVPFLDRVTLPMYFIALNFSLQTDRYDRVLNHI